MHQGNKVGSNQKIRLAAKKLFWKHGVKRISVEEICKEAGVSKMTFYRKFKNKAELVNTLLEQIYTEGFNDYINIMNREISFPEKVKEIVILKHRSAIDLSPEFMGEVYQSDDPDLQKLIQDLNTSHLSRMRFDFEKAQQEGWIRSDLSLDSIFYLLGVIQEKIHDPVYLALHKNVHDAIMELTNFFFYGVLNQTKDESEK